ncbi:MAG: hemolysin, partial [Tannerella sp.]|nr:hemolysin [Tannerella sp.]
MQAIIPPVDRESLQAELTSDKLLRRTNKSNNEIYVT